MPLMVVGLGPGNKDHLTLQTCRYLQKAEQVILRTQMHGAVGWLKEEGIAYTSLDALHESSEHFDEFIRRTAEHVLAASKSVNTVYAVADPTNDETVKRLLETDKNIQVLPCVTQSGEALAACGLGGAVLLTPASNLFVYDGQRMLVITELDSKLLAGECKLKLLSHYGADCRCYFLNLSEEMTIRPCAISLEDLDRQAQYDHRTCAVVVPNPLLSKQRFDMEDLLELMRLLRGENGCPWDKKQTHTSLRPYLIEEAYEAAMAIDEGDEQHIAEELGDVLLQVALHAVIGEEYGTMDLSEMTTAICQKMIARHRHVFGEDKCRTPEEVIDNWTRIKMEERGQKTYGETMLEIKRGMPPMLRAYKVQKKAADIGFDWDNAYGALDKVLEEAQEIREEMNKGADPSLEVGDLFFSCVNLTRLLKVDSEKILSQATEKFINRFIRMEKFAQKDKKSLKSLTIDEFSVYWDRSKAE